MNERLEKRFAELQGMEQDDFGPREKRELSTLIILKEKEERMNAQNKQRIGYLVGGGSVTIPLTFPVVGRVFASSPEEAIEMFASMSKVDLIAAVVDELDLRELQRYARETIVYELSQKNCDFTVIKKDLEITD